MRYLRYESNNAIIIVALHMLYRFSAAICSNQIEIDSEQAFLSTIF